MSKTAQTEKFNFQTEVQQLLHLMIHSLYSHKEIFLRELISNASDACDRLRFDALTDNSLLEDDAELKIRISFDKKARTITVWDNGIGMGRDEVIDNIGTIARSGTKQFVQAATGNEMDDANLIGQFGVGFYSVFMVAEQVTLTTRRAGFAPDEAVRWQSDGTGEYSIETVAKQDRGTEIVLQLRKEEKEFLDGYRLRSIVSKYSDHISLPINMLSEPDKDSKKEPNWETVNKGSALWARPKKEITEEEYNTFFTTLSYDPNPPSAIIHNRVEGKLEYISLFFIPSTAPFDLWDKDRLHGIKLYVRRIFIMDDSKHLMPAYLRFVRGIVDSADLPLNVSREYLQHNKDIDKIRSGSVKKILAELRKIAKNDTDKYATLWREFGRVIKEGIVEDPDNRKTLADLLRFSSTHDDSEGQLVSLAQYVNRMPAKQKAIYYITAETHTGAKSSPHLEIFRKQAVEVLLLSDPIDEWLVTHLTEYEEKPLKSVAKGALDLDELDAEEIHKNQQKKEGQFNELVNKIQDVLKDKVKEVRLSTRLTDSPACLVADEHDMGGNLERILKAVGQNMPTAKPVLEINADHPLINKLQNDRDRLEDWAFVLFDQAALSEGAPLSEPAAYVRRINSLLSDTLLKNESIIITP
ncbi:MAG: molecular chaperone HtpG [Gammaproteobacteria bacterium]|nr:molecular chaperone HtpG [Gammaproteobacteria bacterium]